MPEWRKGAQPNRLIDIDTGKPFALTDLECALLVEAVGGIKNAQPFAKQSFDRIAVAQCELTLGDVMFLERPLMEVQKAELGLTTPEENKVINNLRHRLHRSAAAMVKP